MKLDKNRLVQIFLDLVRIDGVSLNERGVANHVKSFLSDLDIDCVEDDVGNRIHGNCGNVIATKKGSLDRDSILLMAHLDTVSSTKDLVPIIRDDKIHSSGNTILGADDRAGVAVILYLLEEISRNNYTHRDVEVVFSVAEELGMYGSQELDTNRLKSREGIILDCSRPLGSFVQHTPTAIDFTINIRGKAAHSGVAPEKGVNALLMSVKLVESMLPIGRIDDDTVANIGTINGGTAINVIPDQVKMTGEIRSFNDVTLKRIMSVYEKSASDIASEYGGKIDVAFETGFQGFKLDSDLDIICELKRIFAELDFDSNALRYYGGSDANVMNSKNIQTVNIGVGVNNPHSYDEYIGINDLYMTAHVISAILEVE